MPRRGNVPKRDVLPDPMYNSKVVTKLINQIMLDGKKGTAQTIVYDAFKIMGEKLNMEPMEIFKQAMENVMPVVDDVKHDTAKMIKELETQANLKKVYIKAFYGLY